MINIATVASHNTTDLSVGEFAPKPTAITEGLLEASLEIWRDGNVETGIWECTPGEFYAEREGFDEFCTILSGKVTLIVEGQEPVEFHPGDILVTPAGWKGVWRVHEQLRKHYTIVTK